ncbi:hypothetical protein PENTCL1PPCAC_2912, partial [Pristionchus entomophagus]
YVGGRHQGNGTPGMHHSRAAAGGHSVASPGGSGGVPHMAATPSLLQLSAPPARRLPPHPMTPGMRIFNVQRVPGGPMNQRRILVPVSQTPPSLQQQQPREGETPPPSSASPMGYDGPPAKQQLMQPVHLQLPQSATPAAGMIRRPMPIAGTPMNRQRPTHQQQQAHPADMQAYHQQQQQKMLQAQHRQPQQTPRGAGGAAATGRPVQHPAAGTPHHHPRAAAVARTASRTSAAGGNSQQQLPRYNRQQMQHILRTTANAIEKVRQLRSTVRSSFIGGIPYGAIDPSDAAPNLNEDQHKKKVEKIQSAKGILDSLFDSLRGLPNSTLQMYGGKERELAFILDNEERRKEGKGEYVGEEIERTLMGEEARTAFFTCAFECLAKQPMGRNIQGAGVKDGLNAHSSFMLCLSKMQTSKRVQQQRNLKIRVMNNGPRDTRFEMCISTPHTQYPTTTVMRVVITVCDGCLARATFLGPNELVDSATEERSAYLVYRQMSINATEALLSTAKGRQMSLMSSINSIFAFLQNYPQCMQMPCSECGKSLREFMPPTRFVNLNPLKYAHPDCHQPDR